MCNILKQFVFIISILGMFSSNVFAVNYGNVSVIYSADCANETFMAGTVCVDNEANLRVKTLNNVNAEVGAVENYDIGTVDAFARKQVWNKMDNSVLRMGCWGADGDANCYKSSEGIVVYGDSIPTGNAISASNGSYARIKNNRFGLFTIDSTTGLNAVYIWRVDASSMFYVNDSNVKTFKVTRSTGDTEVGKLKVNTSNTGANAGTDICIDANNELCACGSCA